MYKEGYNRFLSLNSVEIQHLFLSRDLRILLTFLKAFDCLLRDKQEFLNEDACRVIVMPLELSVFEK